MGSLPSKEHCSFRVPGEFTHFGEPSEGTGITGISSKPRQLLCSLLVSGCFPQVSQTGCGAWVTRFGSLPGQFFRFLRLTSGHFHLSESCYCGGITRCRGMNIQALSSFQVSRRLADGSDTDQSEAVTGLNGLLRQFFGFLVGTSYFTHFGESDQGVGLTSMCGSPSKLFGFFSAAGRLPLGR